MTILLRSELKKDYGTMVNRGSSEKKSKWSIYALSIHLGNTPLRFPLVLIGRFPRTIEEMQHCVSVNDYTHIRQLSKNVVSISLSEAQNPETDNTWAYLWTVIPVTKDCSLGKGMFLIHTLEGVFPSYVDSPEKQIPDIDFSCSNVMVVPRSHGLFDDETGKRDLDPSFFRRSTSTFLALPLIFCWYMICCPPIQLFNLYCNDHFYVVGELECGFSCSRFRVAR
ncbi:unnamed protein product [Vicia faba]|uniref:Uncharacterized protein n=1 Tax=Vicia faba TaxID=3906 RepID=A0AAV0ZB16_VICFA|nr:unnamed protein product [Vicia faba]